MSHYYIKPDRDQDFYVVMETEIENWVFAGTAEELAEYEVEFAAERRREYKELGLRPTADYEPERYAELVARSLATADEHGSSSMRGRSRWDRPWVNIENGYRLRREDLVRYAELTQEGASEGSKEEAAALLISPDDD
ncbi:hypothetical protein [Nonomuraea sp. SYSU D8015]|uniref:hypothetical protein n=1 Tax=Nonomuraea sp. SYSU D8015 TaxID=2593644 RepID=UPI001660A491|nr:hypothetical protein [Nonomuraea sp. SYSU D8015]